jgi:hypothetical protein
MTNNGTGVVHIPVDRDSPASTYNVSVGAVSAAIEISIRVENIGEAQIRAGLTTDRDFTGFATIPPGHAAQLSAKGTNNLNTTLNLYVPQQPRYVPMHDTRAPIPLLPGRALVHRSDL